MKKKINKRWGLGVAFAALVFFLAAQSVSAAGWEIRPIISATGTYSDNIELSSTDEDSDFVTAITPELSVSRKASRYEVDFDYMMQNLFYAEDSDRNETFHKLDFLSSAEIIRNFFFLEASAGIAQVLEDSQRQSTVRNINATGNTTDVFDAGITPSIEWDLGGYATAAASYNYAIRDFDEESDIVNGAGDIEDSERNEVIGSLGNFGLGDKFGWQVQYQRSHVDFDERPNITLERVEGEIAYELSRALTVLGTYGHENNNYAENIAADDAEGDYWDAGLSYQISPRNLIEVRRGERFFGNTWSGRWEYSGRILQLSAAYSEDITSDALEPARELGTTPEFSRSDIDTDAPSDRTSVFESNRVDLGAIMTLAKTRFSLSVFQEDREFQDTLREEEAYGALFEILWQFGPRTSLRYDLFWEKEKFDDPVAIGDRTTENSFDTGVTIERLLTPRTRANIEYAYSEGDTGNDDEFEANIISLGIAHEF